MKGRIVPTPQSLAMKKRDLVFRGLKQGDFGWLVQMHGELNARDEDFEITGTIRLDDAGLADGDLTYRGKGAPADSNAIGWLARFFISPIWPF